MLQMKLRKFKTYLILAFLVSAYLLISSVKLGRNYTTVNSMTGSSVRTVAAERPKDKVELASRTTDPLDGMNSLCDQRSMQKIKIEDDTEQALCLDGSQPVLYLRSGRDTGERKWIIYLQGSDWCINKGDCMGRTVGISSKDLPESLPLEETTGILSPCKTKNPYFYNWNIVYLPACDGGAFLGSRDEPLIHPNGHSIGYLRGRRIIRAAVRILIQKGLGISTDILLTGCSHSSLGALLSGESLRAEISRANIYILMDGGFFLDSGDPGGNYIFQNVFDMNSLNEIKIVKDCFTTVNATERAKCIYSDNLLQFSDFSIFILTPLYDPWQLTHLGYLKCSESNCISQELAMEDKNPFRGLRERTQHAIKKLERIPNLHFYQTSCLSQCFVLSDDTWNVLRVNGTTPAEAVHRWIMEKATIRKYADCGSPQCNDLCPSILRA